jgi:hypothetical protein
MLIGASTESSLPGSQFHCRRWNVSNTVNTFMADHCVATGPEKLWVPDPTSNTASSRPAAPGKSAMAAGAVPLASRTWLASLLGSWLRHAGQGLTPPASRPDPAGAGRAAVKACGETR